VSTTAQTTTKPAEPVPAGATSRQAARDRARAFIARYGIFLIFGVMVIVASFLSPAFLTTTNIVNVIRQMSIIGLIALGVTGVIVTGGIDLSSGSVVGAACVVAAQRVGECEALAHLRQQVSADLGMLREAALA